MRVRLAAILAVAVAVLWSWASWARAQDGPNRAALVIRYADGSVETACVGFSEASISGEELLLRSGLPIVMDYNAAAGGAVCRIRELGCSTQDCFCRCRGRDCQYWAYYHWIDGAWQYSQIGASSYRVENGALEGWSWGPGNFSAGTEPPQIGFEEVCASGPSAVPPPGPGASPAAGYGAFFAAVALLLGAGFWVMRRRAEGAKCGDCRLRSTHGLL